MLCHDDHVYATIWKDAKDLKTLNQVLRFLGKMNRMTDVGVVCCISIEHTRHDKGYTVPEYISGHDLLNCAKSMQMGFKVGGYEQKEKQGVDGDTATGALAASPEVKWEKAGKSRHACRKNEVHRLKRRNAWRRFSQREQCVQVRCSGRVQHPQQQQSIETWVACVAGGNSSQTLASRGKPASQCIAQPAGAATQRGAGGLPSRSSQCRRGGSTST